VCGIVGLANPSRRASELEAVIGEMNDRIVHRGPDDSGCIARDGLAIGMRRLSIIDLSGGHQPISNETKDIHIVCNGEIYNFRSVRQELENLLFVLTTFVGLIMFLCLSLAAIYFHVW
jgi:asparagine synthase (glutamine-hydrolysing)